MLVGVLLRGSMLPTGLCYRLARLAGRVIVAVVAIFFVVVDGGVWCWWCC